jgi:hypothetical protein
MGTLIEHVRKIRSDARREGCAKTAGAQLGRDGIAAQASGTLTGLRLRIRRQRGHANRVSCGPIDRLGTPRRQRARLRNRLGRRCRQRFFARVAHDLVSCGSGCGVMASSPATHRQLRIFCQAIAKCKEILSEYRTNPVVLAPCAARSLFATRTAPMITGRKPSRCRPRNFCGVFSCTCCRVALSRSVITTCRRSAAVKPTSNAAGACCWSGHSSDAGRTRGGRARRTALFLVRPEASRACSSAASAQLFGKPTPADQ